MRRRGRVVIAALLAGAPAAGALGAQSPVQELRAPQPVAASERYPYGGPAFRQFVGDSYRVLPGQAQPFEAWLEAAYAKNPKAQLQGQATLQGALAARRAQLASTKDATARAALERDTGAWLHRLTKALIPKFSLERGFEFVNTVQLGERQCLLQSVLISGLAQAMGVDAGTAMVWRNEKGQTSNLGHVVAVFKLASGEDVLVDASDPQPFMRHAGLLMRDTAAGGWRFLEPSYDAQANITAYRRSLDGSSRPPAQVRPLSVTYLRSQFYYYRGERTPGGFMGPSTTAGLAASARFLETATKIEPGNALAVYVLGLVYRKQGRNAEAKAQLERGLALYEGYGFVPDGPRRAASEN